MKSTENTSRHGRRKANLIFSLVLAGLALILLAVGIFTHRSGARAVIDFGGGQTETISLSTDHLYSYEVGAYLVQLQVENGRIAFIDSECPDHICEQFGWLENSGDWACCMPAGVYVKIE